MRGMDIRQLVAEFTERLHAAVDQISVRRAREAVMHALGEKRGRLPKGMAAILGRKPRRKGPRQLCPVPGCQNPAAPVFGMVCAQHKDVSKTKIKQYREARRAAKLGAKDGAERGATTRAKRSGGTAAARTTAGRDGVKARGTKTGAGDRPARPGKTTRPAKAGRARKPAVAARPPAADKTTDTARPAKVEPGASAARPSTTSSEIAGAAP